ncbi:MAG: hypothetical protein UFM30_08020 [Bacteroidales bacterium]|nr:hypothetical protein [Bacteroidales bacterium]
MKTKMNLLTPENAQEIVGGGNHIVKVCATVEVKQCAAVEGKYCGTGAALSATTVEIIGPVNPWGDK